MTSLRRHILSSWIKNIICILQLIFFTSFQKLISSKGKAFVSFSFFVIKNHQSPADKIGVELYHVLEMVFGIWAFRRNVIIGVTNIAGWESVSHPIFVLAFFFLSLSTRIGSIWENAGCHFTRSPTMDLFYPSRGVIIVDCCVLGVKTQLLGSCVGWL